MNNRLEAMNILQVTSSISGANGESSRLAADIVAALRARHPAARVKTRDLAADPIPHLDGARVGAFFAKTPEDAQREVLAYSDALIGELREADAVVIGAPLYNFGIPSQLKSWIDHVTRAGVTFRYTDQGPVGLLAGKKAYVAAARGGFYAGTPADTQTAYLRAILGFIGIADVDFVYAEGLAVSPEAKAKGLAASRARVQELLGEKLAA